MKILTCAALIFGLFASSAAIAADPLFNMAARTTAYESHKQVKMPVQLDRSPSKAVSITLRTVNGTAKAPADYTATTKTFTWAKGKNTRQYFIVPIKHDSVNEPVESVKIQVVRSSGLRVSNIARSINIVNSRAPAGTPPTSTPPVVVAPSPVVPAPVTPTAPYVPNGSFRVFNSMLYKDMPDNMGERTATVYQQSFYAGTTPNADGTPSNQGIANAVINARSQANPPLLVTNSLTVMDIELWHVWPWVTGEQHKTNIKKYASALGRFGDAMGTDVCAYAIAPQAGIVHSNFSLTQPAVRQAWTQHSNVTRNIMVPKADALCPSIYVYYRDTGNDYQINYWKNYAIETIKEARRIAPDKPVYPFIWPQYHTGGGVSGWPYIPAKYWRVVVQTIRDNADGVVLWGGSNLAGGGQLQWDENAEWVKITREVFGL